MAKATRVTDRDENEMVVRTGVDGKNPITPENPSAKQMMGAPVDSAYKPVDNATHNAEQLREETEASQQAWEETEQQPIPTGNQDDTYGQ